MPSVVPGIQQVFTCLLLPALLNMFLFNPIIHWIGQISMATEAAESRFRALEDALGPSCNKGMHLTCKLNCPSVLPQEECRVPHISLWSLSKYELPWEQFAWTVIIYVIKMWNQNWKTKHRFENSPILVFCSTFWLSRRCVSIADCLTQNKNKMNWLWYN